MQMVVAQMDFAQQPFCCDKKGKAMRKKQAMCRILVFLLVIGLGQIGGTKKIYGASIATGTYSISGNLISATADTNSMGNASIVKPMTLVSNNGSLSLQLEFVPLTIGLGTASFTGYLAEFSYFPDWEGGSSGYDQPTGETPSAATVVSYYEGIYDSYNDPDSGTDENIKGKLYPHVLTIPVEQNDTEIWVQVYVPVMESISTGGGKQYARLQLDWSSITKLSDEISDTGTDTENTESTENTGNTESSESTETTTSTVNKKGLHNMILTAASLAAKTDLYTSDSVEALNDAIDAAETVYNNDSATQTQVDAQITALSKAIRALEEKADDTLDINSLEDGTYYLYGKMQKIDKKTLSMSNAAIDHIITLTVKNGKYYLTMEFSGLTVNSQKGYLGNLKYFTNSYTVSSTGAPKGTTKPVTVNSYQKKGSKLVSDQYGSKYPAKVTFPMIEKAKKNGYVPLQVFVPLMDSISKGSGTQPVYLKLDLSSITADKSNVTESDDDDETTTTTATTTTTTTTTAGTVSSSTLKSGSTLPKTTGTTTAAVTAAAATKGTTANATAGSTQSKITAGAQGDTSLSNVAASGSADGGIVMENVLDTGAYQMAAESATDVETTVEPENVAETSTGSALEETTAKSRSDALPSVMSVLVIAAGVIYKVRSRM